LMDGLNEMYGKLGDKTLEVMQKNQELEAERVALEERVKHRTHDLETLNQQLLANNVELQQLNEKLETAHTQLLQSEKMASIGQLAAGVAHEINNPVGFVNSNLGALEKYMDQLFQVIAAYGKAEVLAGGQLNAEVDKVKASVDLPYLMEDIPNLVKESRDGLARVKQIIQDLKDFSHVDESTWQMADLEKGMDSTLNVVSNEIKYKAEVVKEYAALPDVECMPSQINQVFMNLLVNAAQAIEEKGVITIRSGTAGDEVWLEVADSGKGIAPEHLNRIFDPFFTTKPIGKGTGLGLSLSYGIVQKHHGRIEAKSELGKGTAMRVWLPLRQEESA
jgi:two-component system, NtrC family, sensor kinase